jgi:hypothetical protein
VCILQGMIKITRNKFDFFQFRQIVRSKQCCILGSFVILFYYCKFLLSIVKVFSAFSERHVSIRLQIFRVNNLSPFVTYTNPICKGSHEAGGLC